MKEVYSHKTVQKCSQILRLSLLKPPGKLKKITHAKGYPNIARFNGLFCFEGVKKPFILNFLGLSITESYSCGTATHSSIIRHVCEQVICNPVIEPVEVRSIYAVPPSHLLIFWQTHVEGSVGKLLYNQPGHSIDCCS